MNDGSSSLCLRTPFIVAVDLVGKQISQTCDCRMACFGICFAIDAADMTSARLPATKRIAATSSSLTPELAAAIYGAAEIYAPLHSWQIRLLRLPSRQEHSFKNTYLKADLVVANLIDTEGVLLPDCSIVGYHALSWTWGDSNDRTELLWCGDSTLMISRNLALALLELQCPAKAMHLWVDQVCINQGDSIEKAVQVAQMLRIYKKAESVIAWLGQADMDSALASACLRNGDDLMQELRKPRHHLPLCMHRLESFYGALTGLYTRPWLRRAWIRQEIYAAKKVDLRCGADQICWSSFISGADLRYMIELTLHPHQRRARERGQSIGVLIAEASSNTSVPWNIMKRPRNLIDLLLRARHFETTLDQDSIYAILGICGVSTTTNVLEAPSKMIVDYRRPAAQVYLDVQMHLLAHLREKTHKEAEHHLATFWNYHETRSCPKDRNLECIGCHECHRRNLGLPTWYMNWKTSLVTDTDIAAIRETWEHEWAAGDFAAPARSPVELLVSPPSLLRGESPELPVLNDHTLQVEARFIGYIAFPMDYTCGLKSLVIENVRMDTSYVLQTAHHIFREGLVPFDARQHSRRLAMLGLGQPALVPATAQVGDLIIAVAPGVLPLLVRPHRRGASCDRPISFGPFLKSPTAAQFYYTSTTLAHEIPTNLVSLVAIVGCVLLVAPICVIVLQSQTVGPPLAFTVSIMVILSSLVLRFVIIGIWGFYITKLARECLRNDLEYLDGAVGTVGDDFEFLGPVFLLARPKRGPSEMVDGSDLSVEEFLGDKRTGIAVNKERRGLSRFFRFQDGERVRDPRPRPWDRPIQKLKLH